MLPYFCLEVGVRKYLVFFFIIFLSLLCLGCRNIDCEVEGYGEVYLKILDENGNAFPDTEAERFRVTHTQLGIGRQQTIINEKDELIFSLGTIKIKYNSCKRIKKKEGFTDNEIRDALSEDLYFSIKDTKEPQEYKTIENRSYKSCFIDFERTNIRPATYVSRDNPTHIYRCEVRLVKK